MLLKIQNRLLLNKRFLSILTLGDKRQLGMTGKRKRGREKEGERKGQWEEGKKRIERESFTIASHLITKDCFADFQPS